MSQIPDGPVREGSRWRHHKPTADEVAAWFKAQPIDEGMEHEDYVGGVVIIPASEKVKAARADGRGTEERYEQTFTPYVRVDTRVTYFRNLAELRGYIAVIEPVAVPRIEEGQHANKHMPDGFWWHVVATDQAQVRYLCCTMRVALYDKEAWTSGAEFVSKAEQQTHSTELNLPRPLREGVATKQVAGGTDMNGLAKAETGAIGRALGVAGILVVGSGIATAEDMAELRDAPEATGAALPEAGAPEETSEALNARLLGLQERLKTFPEAWTGFCAWWKERSQEGGWSSLNDAPIEVRRGMAGRMEQLIGIGIEEATRRSLPAQDSSSSADAEEAVGP